VSYIDVAASVSWCHVDLWRTALPSLGRNWAGADRPQPFSTRFASVYRFCVSARERWPKADAVDGSFWREWLTRTRPNHDIRDKIRPADAENTSEAPLANSVKSYNIFTCTCTCITTRLVSENVFRYTYSAWKYSQSRFRLNKFYKADTVYQRKSRWLSMRTPMIMWVRRPTCT